MRKATVELLWIGAAAFAGAGVVLVLAAPKPGGGARMDWVDKLLRRVSSNEGGYDALNRNTDGAGLSFGIIQWTQRGGNLGKLLDAMVRADGDRFQAIMGGWPATRALLGATTIGDMGPVDGYYLWQEPWVGRFRKLGEDPVFQAVQRRVARTSDYWKAAEDCAAILGLRTERAMTLYLDTAVQQGPGAARTIARRVAGGDPSTVLSRYAQAAADRLRSADASSSLRQGLEWRKHPDGYHIHTSRGLDLYADVLRRRTGILRDTTLTDDALGDSA